MLELEAVEQRAVDERAVERDAGLGRRIAEIDACNRCVHGQVGLEAVGEVEVESTVQVGHLDAERTLDRRGRPGARLADADGQWADRSAEHQILGLEGCDQAQVVEREPGLETIAPVDREREIDVGRGGHGEFEVCVEAQADRIETGRQVERHAAAVVQAALEGEAEPVPVEAEGETLAILARQPVLLQIGQETLQGRHAPGNRRRRQLREVCRVEVGLDVVTQAHDRREPGHLAQAQVEHGQRLGLVERSALGAQRLRQLDQLVAQHTADRHIDRGKIHVDRRRIAVIGECDADDLVGHGDAFVDDRTRAVHRDRGRNDQMDVFQHLVLRHPRGRHGPTAVGQDHQPDLAVVDPGGTFAHLDLGLQTGAADAHLRVIELEAEVPRHRHIIPKPESEVARQGQVGLGLEFERGARGQARGRSPEVDHPAVHTGIGLQRKITGLQRQVLDALERGTAQRAQTVVGVPLGRLAEHQGEAGLVHHHGNAVVAGPDGRALGGDRRQVHLGGGVIAEHHDLILRGRDCHLAGHVHKVSDAEVDVSADGEEGAP